MTDDYQLVQVSAELQPAVDRFLERVYKPSKVQFLKQYKDWWYRGTKTHLAIVRSDGEVVAHSAIIPSMWRIAGQDEWMHWWVDLVVAPECRGQGLQTVLDDTIRESIDLKGLLPARERAVPVFEKHGWIVRYNVHYFSLPLALTAFPRFRHVPGFKRLIARAAIGITTPFTALLRAYLSRYRPTTARRLESPDPDVLEQTFREYNCQDNLVTTVRDSAYITWRFLDAPYFDELSFYAAGPTDLPSQIVITRTLNLDGVKTCRILDIFGNLDGDGLRDVLRLAVRDAAQQGVAQIIAFSTCDTLSSAFRSLRFFDTRRLIFGWHTHDPNRSALLEQSDYHWTFADSDADAVY
jgi:GNAT superfamily N-acetyltransferase